MTLTQEDVRHARAERLSRPLEASAPLIIALSAASGAGKTTVCRKAAALASARGYLVAGILTTLRRGPSGERGLDVEDIQHRVRRPLAETTGSADGPIIGPWRFHKGGLEWGDAVLARATPCDLLVVDELGPLELVHGTGWAQALPALLSGAYRVGLAVVRPALIGAFLGRLEGRRAITVTVTPSNRDGLPGDLVAQLAGG